MGSGDCWLMIEGQNFGASIFDTQDLSTIRGGSLLLRDLVRVADDFLKKSLPKAVEATTLGGSVGIWRLSAKPPVAAKLAADLRKHLDGEAARHLAYGLALVADEGPSFRRQRNRLRAALQHGRLTETRLPYPALDNVERAVCPVDLVRPVAMGTRQKIGPNKTSLAIYERRRFGMDKKQSLIVGETAKAGDALCAKAKE